MCMIKNEFLLMIVLRQREREGESYNCMEIN